MATKTRRTGGVIRLAYEANNLLVKLNSHTRAAIASCSTGELEFQTADLPPLRSFVASVEALRTTYAGVGPAIDTLGVNLIPDYADRRYLPRRAWRQFSKKASPKKRGVLALVDLASNAGLAANKLGDSVRDFVTKFLTTSEYFNIHEQPRELLDMYTLLREMNMGAEVILGDLASEPLLLFKTQLNMIDRPVSSVCEMPLESKSTLKVDAASTPSPSTPACITRQVRKTRDRRAARKTETAAREAGDLESEEAVRVHEQEMARCRLNRIPAPTALSFARRRRRRGGIKAQTPVPESTTGGAKEPEVGEAEPVAPNVGSAAVAADAPEGEMPTLAAGTAEPHGCTGHSRRRRRRGAKKHSAAAESTDGGAGKSAGSEAEVGPRAAVEAKLDPESSSAEVSGVAAVEGASEGAKPRRRKARKVSRAPEATATEGAHGDAALPDATCPSPTAESLAVGARSDGGATTDPASPSSSDAEKKRRNPRLRRRSRSAAKKGEESMGNNVEENALTA